MQLPLLLPKKLVPYESAESEETLLNLLVKKPSDLLLFFEAACDDETWSEEHGELMQKVIGWFTVQIYHDQLPFEFCMRAVKAMRKHYSVLSPWIPRNITLKLKDKDLALNSLMLASTSDFFKHILQTECLEKHKTTLELSKISYEHFQPVEAYIQSGVAADLWKKRPQELMALLAYVKAWGIEELIQACEEVLGRYLTRDNVFEMLLKTHLEGWYHLKQCSISFINSLDLGFKLFLPSNEKLGAEFQSFSEATLERFQQLSQYMTDIACHGDLIDQSGFIRILKLCPNLLFLDISHTPFFSQNFYELPKELSGINLSECPWTSAESLKHFSQICPHLQKVMLCHNMHLNFSAWGELIKFKGLMSLDISNCRQLENGELAIILNGCGGALREFAMANCTKINYKGFYELAMHAKRVANLNLSYCNVTDASLVDIATHCLELTKVNLSHCTQLSEKGILALVKNAFLLDSLDITHCRVTTETINELRKIKPSLAINSDSP